MKRPLAYITAAWLERRQRKRGTGRPVLPGGVRGRVFADLPITLYLPLFLNDAVPRSIRTALT